MQTLPEQFKGALTRIQVDPKIAIQTQVQVRAVLEANLELRRWGIDTVLIGSYSRGTGVHPGRDVDIFAKLTALDTSSNPSDVFNLVRDVLVDRYQDKASPQPRSIKIAVSDDFSADVVPAVRRGDDWAIPARDPELWGDPAKRWRTTNPEKLGALTTDRNKTPKVAGQGAYVPVVKLVRQTRRHHLGDLKPGGLYMELGCYRAFEDCVSFGDSYAEIFADTLRRVGDQLASGVVLADPALGTAYDPAPETSARAVAGERFHQLAAKAAAALQMDPCQAALGWRQILGDNPDGPCFPLPEGCETRGEESLGSGRSGRRARMRRGPLPKIQTLDPAGLDRFTTELIGAGFHAVAGTGRRKWVGPILPCLSSLTVVETMGIEITDGWPYVQPRPVVRGVSGEHSNAAGVICLWRSDEVGLPWLTWDAIARRTEEWCERTAHGFREADEMLDAYVGFERTDSDVLVTFDLATLTAGIEQDGKHQRIHGLKEHDALISIHPGKGPAGSIPGRLFYRDTLSATPRTLADVERALTPAQLGRLNGDMRRRRTGDPPIDLAIVVWQRGGIEDLLVLRVDRSDGGFGLVSLEPAPRDAESLALRSGLDRGALSTKKVVVFGAGAVGSHAALLMGECGVGRLLLVDGDRIRPGNVVRHVAGGAVGRNKAQATALELEAHCPWVETKTVQSNIFGPNDIAKLIGGCDLVLDAAGVWSFQQQLSSIVAESRTPLVSASLYRGGSVGRVRRQMADDEPIKDRTEGSAYYTIPREEEVADYGLEVGCSAPVTSAPPSAVAAVAALAVQVVQDALTGRNAYQPEITEVYAQLEQPPFDRVGRLQWPRS